MAMGKRQTKRQPELWISATAMPEAPGHPFYRRLNQLLAEHGFDAFAEDLCGKFYHESLGRPGIPPGVYFRMLLIGYFEGIDSERGIAWRCADSLALRSFLGYALTEGTPDHSSLSVIRNRIDMETHEGVHFAAIHAEGDQLDEASAATDGRVADRDLRRNRPPKRRDHRPFRAQAARLRRLDKFPRSVITASGSDTGTQSSMSHMPR